MTAYKGCEPHRRGCLHSGSEDWETLVICVYVLYPCHLGCAPSVLLYLVFVQHLPSHWCLLPRHPAVLPVPPLSRVPSHLSYTPWLQFFSVTLFKVKLLSCDQLSFK